MTIVTDKAEQERLGALFDTPQATPASNSGVVTDATEIDRLNALIETQTNEGDPAVLSSKPSVQEQQQAGFLADLGQSFDKNVQQLTDTISGFTGLTAEQAKMTGDYDPQRDEISGGQAAWQTVANPINFLFDIAGNTLKAAGNAAYEILPERSQEQLAADWERVKQMPEIAFAMDAARGGAEKWEQFETAYPQAAKTVASGFDVYGMFAGGPKPIKPLPKSVEITPYRVRQVPGSIGRRHEARPPKAYEKDVYNIVKEDTPRASRAEASRTTDPSLLRGKESVIPTLQEWDMVDAAKKAGVSGNKTMRQNLRAINRRIVSLSEQLVNKAKGKDIHVPSQKILTDIVHRVNGSMQKNPGWGKNRAKSAQPVVDQAAEILRKHPDTPEGVLAARREFDDWVENYYGEEVFTGNKANVVKSTVADVRNQMNDELKMAVPEAADLLDEMSKLYSASGNVLPKAAREAHTLVARIGQNLALVMPKSPLGWLMMGSMAGSAGLSAVMGGALAVPVLLGGYVGARKLGLSTPFRTAQGAVQYTYGDVLRELNKAIKASKDNGQMLRQLKADRAALIGLMKEVEQGNGEQSD